MPLRLNENSMESTATDVWYACGIVGTCGPKGVAASCTLWRFFEKAAAVELEAAWQSVLPMALQRGKSATGKSRLRRPPGVP
mmetsp:Transcript_54391/g.150890  ORF Transcript_54391/g.150890 Transcript_54391/m.150890 type:complete len:82 (-) Transcript_54391:7-252(-)